MANPIHIIPFALAPDTDPYNTNPATDRIRHPGTGNLYFVVVEGAGGTGTARSSNRCGSPNGPWSVSERSLATRQW